MPGGRPRPARGDLDQMNSAMPVAGRQTEPGAPARDRRSMSDLGGQSLLELPDAAGSSARAGCRHQLAGSPSPHLGSADGGRHHGRLTGHGLQVTMTSGVNRGQANTWRATAPAAPRRGGPSLHQSHCLYSMEVGNASLNHSRSGGSGAPAAVPLGVRSIFGRPDQVDKPLPGDRPDEDHGWPVQYMPSAARTRFGVGENSRGRCRS